MIETPTPPPTVVVQLDGRPHAIAAGTRLAELVAALGHAPNAVSTAVNARFVGRGARADLVLQPGDEVALFQPIVGG